jgi:hypothetical protein
MKPCGPEMAICLSIVAAADWHRWQRRFVRGGIVDVIYRRGKNLRHAFRCSGRPGRRDPPDA